jgi:hypothetical protein
MTLHISLNGRDITEYGITPMDGIINALMKPAGYKKLITNSNAAFDGVVPVINAQRKKDSRTVTLNFYLRSTSLIDRRRDVETLEAALVAGIGNGVNELYVSELEQTYRLIFEGITSFNANVHDKAIIAIKFMEFCPTAENRVP